MKKILSVLIILATLLTLASCAKYKPVESTKEEKQVVMTMKFGDREYEVRYELYRALFLNNKSEVDGGDESVWTGEGRAEAVKKINALIERDAANIFAAFYIADVGANYDVFAAEADKKVEEYVEASVDGGEYGTGFGSYDKYLEHLKSINLNYSTQDLMFRYYIALEKIDEYYVGDTSSDSLDSDEEIHAPHLEYSFDLVRDFYYSDRFARIVYAYFSESSELNPNFNIENFHAQMKNKANEGADAVINFIGGFSLAQDINTGVFISENSFNNELFDKINDAAIELDDGEVSDIIKIDGTGDDYLNGYYILYGLEKTEEDFETYYSQVLLAYFDDVLGERLSAHRDALRKSVKYTDAYSNIDHSKISMN